jgi:hypothetical protein
VAYDLATIGRGKLKKLPMKKGWFLAATQTIAGAVGPALPLAGWKLKAMMAA